MNKLGAVWTVLLGSAFLLCACGEEQPDVPDKSYIGVAYYNQSDTFLNQLLDSFREQRCRMRIWIRWLWYGTRREYSALRTIR